MSVRGTRLPKLQFKSQRPSRPMTHSASVSLCEPHFCTVVPADRHVDGPGHSADPPLPLGGHTVLGPRRDMPFPPAALPFTPGNLLSVPHVQNSGLSRMLAKRMHSVGELWGLPFHRWASVPCDSAGLMCVSAVPSFLFLRNISRGG